MKITPHLRQYLKKPLGAIIKDTDKIPKDSILVCVGDFASKRLLSEGFKPKIVVYDGKTKREDVGVADEITAYKGENHTLVNPPGELVDEAIDLMEKLFKDGKPHKVYVEGEEDLTALAAIKHAPYGAYVVYGQPNEGLVLVKVNSEVKDKIKKVIDEMV
ncbi:MAG: GTP-dependent dephospho-CoA kinase family protein [Candidatus Altiarchaeota archaeon]|nr:GTP-dependent dephospho-CoA kinase family protein [Candidatus Altiarchaeota archaeon]